MTYDWAMAKKADRRPYRATPEQLRALASPVRIEIVGVFQSHGALAIRELAETMGRPMDGLYHHVRLLQNVGVLRAALTRRVGKRNEVVFELTAERFGNEVPSQTKAMKDAAVAAAAAALRLADREFGRAVLSSEKSKKVEPGEQRSAALKLSRQKSWLTDEDLDKLHGMLDEIDSFLRKRLQRKQGRVFALTTVLAPVIKRKRV